MEVKFNNPTDLRPEGDRVLNAPVVKIDLNEYIDQLKDEKTWKEGDRNSITVFKSDNTTIVLVAMKKGAVMERYTVDGMVNIHVLEGKIELTTPEWSEILRKGIMVNLHRDIEHQLKSHDRTVFLLNVNTA